MGFPYTDVAAQYACGGTGNLIDSKGSADITENNVAALQSDGKFGDARGPLGRAGSGAGYFARGWTGTAYDIRGLTSWSLVGWFKLNELTAQPFFFSIYDVNNANEQAIVVYARDFDASFKGPSTHMYDGLSFNNALFIKASTTAAPSQDDWHMVGASWDAGANLLSSFWGDGEDLSGNTTYYDTVAGFVAGHGYTTDVLQVNVARFSALNAPDWDVDHISWWKDRALNESEFLDHWQSGKGLAFNQFASDPNAVKRLAIPWYYGR